MNPTIHATVRRTRSVCGELRLGWTVQIYVGWRGNITRRFKDRSDAITWAIRTVREERRAKARGVYWPVIAA